MRKLGYMLLVSGFLWIAFFAVETNPVARSMGNINARKFVGQQDYTHRDIVIAVGKSAYDVAAFAQLGFAGGLIMLAGGIILGGLGRQSPPPAPPIIGS